MESSHGLKILLFELKKTNLILPLDHQINYFPSNLLHNSTIYELEIIPLFEMVCFFLKAELRILLQSELKSLHFLLFLFFHLSFIVFLDFIEIQHYLNSKYYDHEISGNFHFANYYNYFKHYFRFSLYCL